MTPLKVLKNAVEILNNLPCKFCLIGGHAASLYRKQERFTKDVDFTIVADKPGQSRKLAEDCIKALGLEPALEFIPNNQKGSENKILMVTSKPMINELTGIIDILLPEIPWVPEAIERAQSNKIDLIFDHVPVITPEDLVVAKTYALRNNPDRFQDLDDLKEIFLNVNDLDFVYLNKQLKEFELSLPDAIKKYVKR
jgi:predicted nucleotidyltransferase